MTYATGTRQPTNNWSSFEVDNYNNNYNNYGSGSGSSGGGRMRMCTGAILCWGACAIITGGAITGAVLGGMKVASRKAENRRVDAMVAPTGDKLSALEDSVWDIGCDEDMKRFQSFQSAGTAEACEAAFEEFAANITGCSENATETAAFADAAEEFMTEQPAKAKEDETFLTVACDHKGKVNERADTVHEANCFEAAFNLEGEITDYLNTLFADECEGLANTMGKFINMTDDSCANPQAVADALDRCNATSPSLQDEVDDFINTRRPDNCYKEICDVKKNVNDIASVKTDNNGRHYHGFGMFFPLWFRSGFGGTSLGYSAPTTVTRKNGSRSTVTGSKNYGGSRGGTSGIRGGSGTVGGRGNVGG